MVHSYEERLYYHLTGNDKAVLTKRSTEYGSIKDEDLVLIRIAPPEGKKIPKSKSFEIKIGKTFVSEGIELNHSSDCSFILAQKNFDDMVNSSRILEHIANDEKVLRDTEERVADLTVRKLNDPGAFSADDEEALEDAELLVSKAKKQIAVYVENLYTYYAKFVELKKNKFEAKVNLQSNTVVDHQQSVVRLYKEAFTLDATGVRTTTRYPEKDSAETEDNTPSTGWKFVHKWKRVSENVHAMRGKSQGSFDLCRRQHIASVLPKFGYAEATFDYLLNNVKCPENVPVSDMNEMFEAISPLMYLLPSRRDDTNPSYANGELDHIPRRNLPFSETVMCQMLLNSMPFSVKNKWKAENLGQEIPTNRPLLVVELQQLLDDFNATKKLKGQQGGGQKKDNEKTTGSKNGGGPRTPRNQKKKCSRCDRKGEKDHVKHSHVDADCDRYHPDLTAKVRQHERQLRAQEAVTPPLSGSRDRKRKKKSKKDSKKKSKKSSKPKKKSRRSRSDSSSSDSSSDSSSSSESS